MLKFSSLFKKKEESLIPEGTVLVDFEEAWQLNIHSRCNAFQRWFNENYYSRLASGEVEGQIFFFYIPEDIYNEAKKKYDIIKEEERRLLEVARLNNLGMGLEREGKEDEAIAAYEENIKLGYAASHSYDRLRVIYRKHRDWDNMARVIKCKARAYGYDNKWAEEEILRYMPKESKLENSIVYPDERKLYIVESSTLEERFKKIIDTLPEFEFYTRVSTDKWNIFSFEDAVKLRELRELIKKKLEDAAKQEKLGRLDLAASIYEELLANRVHNTKPYERLIMIYKRAKLDSALKEVLQYAINFFSELRDKQYRYIHFLADKYRVKDIHGIPIDNYGKIFYYGGVFELYNPYLVIEKWKEDLSNL